MSPRSPKAKSKEIAGGATGDKGLEMKGPELINRSDT